MSSRTPAHTLIRVRNNQRRHRVRRREYISSLEQRLQEAESLLAAARGEIVALKAQLDAQSKLTAGAVPGVGNSSSGVSAQPESIQPTHLTPSPLLAGSTAYPPEEAIELLDPAESDSLAEIMPSRSDTAAQLLRPPQTACCSTDNNSSMEPWAEVTVPEWPPNKALDCTCAVPKGDTRSEESTTLCSTAYALVEQQNRLGLSFSAITEWLWRGFRNARAGETGCRVENNLLFGLLDFVSE